MICFACNVSLQTVYNMKSLGGKEKCGNTQCFCFKRLYRVVFRLLQEICHPEKHWNLFKMTIDIFHSVEEKI